MGQDLDRWVLERAVGATGHAKLGANVVLAVNSVVPLKMVSRLFLLALFANCVRTSESFVGEIGTLFRLVLCESRLRPVNYHSWFIPRLKALPHPSI